MISVVVIYTIVFLLLAWRDFLNREQIRVMDELIVAQRDLIKDLEAGLFNPPPRLVLFGSGTPALELGKPGDFYMDLKTLQLYGPKTPKGWSTVAESPPS